MCKIFLLIMTFIACPAISGELTKQDFDKLKKELTPDKNEAWKSIPWKLSVLEAQKTAAQSKKPLFIWAMDGHPLACV